MVTGGGFQYGAAIGGHGRRRGFRYRGESDGLRSRRPEPWELPYRRRHVRTREAPGEELLDVPLAPARGRRYQILVVLGGQERREQPQGREVHRTLGQQAQDDREPTSGPGRLDAEIRLVLGEGQDLATVGEQRGEARAQVEPPRVQLGKMGHETDGRLTLGEHEPLHGRQELGVGEVRRDGDLHALS